MYLCTVLFSPFFFFFCKTFALSRTNECRKHFSAQKRGVTTSYKNEELYTHFHKMAGFLVVMGVVIGLGSHGIDVGIE